MVSKNMEKDIWKIMYDKAREVQNEREISPFIEAGGVAAAILTKSGNIYVGVCIDCLLYTSDVYKRQIYGNACRKNRETCFRFSSIC